MHPNSPLSPLCLHETIETAVAATHGERGNVNKEAEKIVDSHRYVVIQSYKVRVGGM